MSIHHQQWRISTAVVHMSTHHQQWRISTAVAHCGWQRRPRCKWCTPKPGAGSRRRGRQSHGPWRRPRGQGHPAHPSTSVKPDMGPQRNNGITSIVCVIRVRVDAFDNAAPNPNNHNNHNSYNYNRCHHPHTRTWLWMESLNTTANNNKTKHCREQTKDPLPQA